jgi:hypothetical protein
VQILNKGSLDVSRFKVWDSFVVFLHLLVLGRREQMIEKELVLTGSDAELLSRALAEVKTKIYEESEARVDDTQALEALVSCFGNAEKEKQENEGYREYRSLLSKRLVLGTLLDRRGGADTSRLRR